MATIGDFDPLNSTVPATKIEITVSCRWAPQTCSPNTLFTHHLSFCIHVFAYFWMINNTVNFVGIYFLRDPDNLVRCFVPFSVHLRLLAMFLISIGNNSFFHKEEFAWAVGVEVRGGAVTRIYSESLESSGERNSEIT